MKPIIGISVKLEELGTQFGVLDTQMMPGPYTDAIRDAGGIPVLLPVDAVEHLDRLLDRIDAVVFTGGGDIDPARHGRNHGGTGVVTRVTSTNSRSPRRCESGVSRCWPSAGESRRRYREVIPLGQPHTGDDVANAVVFLASDAAHNVTGQYLHVDGGAVLRD